ncbi:MAG: hypothetical protein WB698_15680 [Solirubrobacteraceae bacterium]
MQLDPSSISPPSADHPLSPASWRRAGAVLIALLLALLLAACGSSSKPTLSSAQVKKQTCKQVEAALSDGPEPEADPVGYAQAQVLPLRQIHTTNRQLAGAITGLASAYQEFSSSNGSGSAKSAVSAATNTIKTLCTGIEL